MGKVRCPLDAFVTNISVAMDVFLPTRLTYVWCDATNDAQASIYICVYVASSKHSRLARRRKSRCALQYLPILRMALSSTQMTGAHPTRSPIHPLDTENITGSNQGRSWCQEVRQW